MRVAIVGSGFSGLAIAIGLQEAGFDDYVIFERDERLGGTWRDNTYPGAACDVPSHLYSLSAWLNPRWSHKFARQAEILAYMDETASRHGILPKIRFGEAVERAEYSAGVGWTILTSTDTYIFDALVHAGGGLNRASIPNFPGLSEFEGDIFHTSNWRHDVDLGNHRIAVVGTGASAIQVVPEVAKHASQLDVYMRTPPWILSRDDFEFSSRQQAIFAEFPQVMQAYRARIYAEYESHALAFLHPKLMEIARRDCLKFLRASIADLELREAMTPTYVPGCKRILLSDDFYPAIQRSNVELVPKAVAGLTPSGVVDASGVERPADVVVMATGFDVTENLVPYPVIAHLADGALDLRHVWAAGAFAYKGTVVPGFPNLFLMTGPNTALGHNSMIYMMESQVTYIVGALEHLKRSGAKSAQVKPDVCEAYNRGLQQKLRDTVWETGCVSWYRAKDGQNPTIWPDFTFKFRAQLREFDASNFEMT